MYCPNCGKEIKDGVKFCEHCGINLDEPEKKARPTAPTPKKSVDVPGLFSNKNVFLGIAIGILIMFIGVIISNASLVTDNDADAEDYEDAKGTHKLGMIVYNLGVLILGAILFLGAIASKQMDRCTKIAMILAGALIISLAFAAYGVFNLGGL
jgi:hypothetical protein